MKLLDIIELVNESPKHRLCDEDLLQIANYCVDMFDDNVFLKSHKKYVDKQYKLETSDVS